MYNDKRFLKTKEYLFKSLETILLNNNQGDISISFLCTKINISRNTFYNHYNNVSELYDDYIYSKKEEFDSKIKTLELYPSEKKEDILYDNFKLLFDFRNTMNVIYKLSNGYLHTDRDNFAKKLFLESINFDCTDEIIYLPVLKGIEELLKLWSLKYGFSNFNLIYNQICNFSLCDIKFDNYIK